MLPASEAFSRPAIVVAVNLLSSGVFKRDVNAPGKSMISSCNLPVSLPAVAFSLGLFAISRTLSLLCPACKPLQRVKISKFDVRKIQNCIYLSVRVDIWAFFVFSL